jgi:Zn-dependent peptidase ImmA (M78 family)/transcriptional regulator with XRE-family HTH domain
MSGERIKLARRRAGLSLRELAREMGSRVTAQAIGKYERGEMTPSSDVLIALSKALSVSIPFLMAPEKIELGKVDFRTKAGTGAKDRARVEAEVLEWVGRYLQIEDILRMDSAVWHCPTGMPTPVRNPLQAEALAEALREDWALGIDPIPNMTELLEEKGIKVLIADLPERVDGVTCFVNRPGRNDNGGIPVIVVNKQISLERRRFTMAHELAHRVIESAAPHARTVEKLCHRVAGAFLMPKGHLQQEIGKHRNALGYRELVDLKRLYRVSAAALLVRLEHIDVIDKGTREYAFRTFASGWRIREPDEIEEKEKRGQFEQPKRFERLTFRALAEDMISVSKAAELLRVPIPKVEAGLKGPASRHADHR